MVCFCQSKASADYEAGQDSLVLACAAQGKRLASLSCCYEGSIFAY